MANIILVEMPASALHVCIQHGAMTSIHAV